MESIEEIKQKLSLIEEQIGYQFKDPALLVLAFVHRSFTNENREVVSGHNERLEFLGDAVLGLFVSQFLYIEYPALPEGNLSYLRSRLVEAEACAHYIDRLKLGTYLLLGRGESMNEGKGRSTILADLFEALLGALYLDGGMEVAHSFFFGHFKDDILATIKSPARNWKAELQDYCQKKYHKPPVYEVQNEEGPDHDKVFHIVVKLDDQVLGKGSGSSKKEAEQNSAQEAIETLESS